MSNIRNNSKYTSLILISTLCIILMSTSLTAYQHNSSDKEFDFNSDPYEYFTYQEMTDFLFTLQSQNPQFMAIESLGKSYENRDIWLVTLTNFESEIQQKPSILLLGAHHGNEKPSYEVLIFFIYYVLENYDNTVNDFFIDQFTSGSEIQKALNSTIFYIIPMVNPDGVEANTRKNREPNYGPFGLQQHISSYGVNLNRNYKDNWFLYYFKPFGYHFFFSTLDSSFNYKGPYPFSSNETRAVKEFVETKNISISLSYHTYSEVILYPWMHTSLSTPHEELFVSIGENMSVINNYRLITGRNYIFPRFSGTLGTSENWLYREKEILSFTMELCREYAPTNATIIKKACLNHTAIHLYLSERVQTIEQEKSFFR
jgi:carboxypeptidase T